MSILPQLSTLEWLIWYSLSRNQFSISRSLVVEDTIRSKERERVSRIKIGRWHYQCSQSVVNVSACFLIYRGRLEYGGGSIPTSN